MKFLNYLSFALLFTALSFSVQAMDPPKDASNIENPSDTDKVFFILNKDADKDKIPSIIDDFAKQERLQKKLIAYTKFITNDQFTMGVVSGKGQLVFTIGYEFRRGTCGNALMFILQIIAGQASTNNPSIKDVVESVKEQRSKLIRTTKDDPYLYALLEETKHQNKNRAVAAYFYLIEYTLANAEKAAEIIQNPPEFITVRVPGADIDTTDLITPSPAQNTPKNRNKKSHTSRKAKTLD